MFGLGKKKDKASKNHWVQPTLNECTIYKYIENNGHVMIAGATGSGKSVFMNCLLYSITARNPQDHKIIILDPKKVGYFTFENMPHVIELTTTKKGISDSLDRIIALMDKRYKEMEKTRTDVCNAPMIYVFIDEVADLFSDRGILGKVIKLSQLARQANIKLIMATQSPNRKTLDANLMQNMTCRVGLRCESIIESRQTIGMSGCENLPKFGQCIIKIPMDVVKVSVPFVSKEMIKERLNIYKGYKM